MVEQRPASPRWRRRPVGVRGFTLIELIVAIGVSVVLLAILTFVFQVSTSASRDANSRVSLTERLRSLNLRLRQEVSGMVHKVRDNLSTLHPYTYELYHCFSIATTWPSTTDVPKSLQGTARGANVFAFTTSTVQDGKPVTVDVCYVFQPGGTSTERIPEQGRLIRMRDRTGPEAATKPVKLSATSYVYYQLGDDRFWAADATNNCVGLSEIKSLTYSAADINKFNKWIYSSDVMMINVRNVEFFEVDPPPKDASTQLNPRTLPAGIRMVIVYGPEVGNIDQTQRAEIFFPVQRGL
jgi:prepilin-type N-terminal cleavage/methylation domain-containing protein